MQKILILTLFFLVLIGCGKNGVVNGKYLIGRDQNWFPLQLGVREANVNAFMDALVQEIAKQEDLSLQIVDIDWLQLFQNLENKEFAAIFTSLPPNAITQEKYSFSDPIILLGPVLIVPYNSEATSLNDLNDKIVAVYQFDDSVLIAQKNPSIVIQLYQNMPAVLEELKEGKIDGILMPVLDAKALVSSLDPYQLKIVTAPLNNKAIRLITLKGAHTSLMDHFNRGLKNLFTSSDYNSLRKRYQLILYK